MILTTILVNIFVNRFLIKHLPKQLSQLRNEKVQLEDKIHDLELVRISLWD